MATAGPPVSAMQQAVSTGTGANPTRSDDPTGDAPQMATGEQQAAQQKLDKQCQDALIELRRTFKARYQPKRMRFISEATRAFEAFRGNTYALLNDQSAALDTISQLMQSQLGQNDDPALYAHNENVYQAFAMIFIAALMVDLGKTRFQPTDAQDESTQALAKKASTIHAYNERKNDILSLQQLELLFLWLTGSYFTYVRYVVDKKRAGTSVEPQIEMVPTKVGQDSYICPQCGGITPDSKASLFTNSAQCSSCGSSLSQKDWFEAPTIPMPQQVGEKEVADGMTAFDVINGLMVDVNPDALQLNPLEGTEILDYTIEISAGKVRTAYPAMYGQITPAAGSDPASEGDSAKQARAGMTTPGANNRPMTTEGLVSYSRCWLTHDAFNELEDQSIAQELVKRYPDGCKLVLCGADVFLDAKNEDLLKHWTWCGTIKGLGPYPPAAGKSGLDIQERVTAAINKIDAHMDRAAYGTMFYDADYIDGQALKNKVLSPGNLTPISRTDEETGERVPLPDLVHQMTFQADPEIYKYVDGLISRGQFLLGVMPQVFGGSDKNVQTAEGQEQSLNTALGRLKQYINQMRGEKARRADLSVRTSVDNMDEEMKIVEENETGDGWQMTKILKAELTGDFFAFPETDEGFPATFAEIQTRIMQLLEQNQKMPFVTQMLSDPDVASVVSHYVLPPELELSGEAERAKIKTVIRMLSEDKNGPLMKPNPMNPAGPPIVIPTITPEPDVDDPQVCQLLAKKWLQKNWQQQQTNQKGYANVLAYLTVSAQLAKEQAAQAALVAQQAQKGAPQPQGQ